MKHGDKVELVPVKHIGKGLADDASVMCSFIRYDETSECIYLKVGEKPLEDLSTDVIFNCKIFCDSESVLCTGRIRERYVGACGKTVCFGIENGFYKISLN